MTNEAKENLHEQSEAMIKAGIPKHQTLYAACGDFVRNGGTADEWASVYHHVRPHALKTAKHDDKSSDR